MNRFSIVIAIMVGLTAAWAAPSARMTGLAERLASKMRLAGSAL